MRTEKVAIDWRGYFKKRCDRERKLKFKVSLTVMPGSGGARL